MSIPSAPARRFRRAAIAVGAVLVAVALFAVGLNGRAEGATTSSTSVAASAPAGGPPVPQIVPKPVSMQVGTGWFTLGAQARIAVSGGAQAMAVAHDLAGYLRPATGFPLPVVAGRGGAGDISLAVGANHAVGSDPDGEGYSLGVTSQGVRLTAGSAHGLYNGIQTIRQLLPAWINSSSVVSVPWEMRAVQIVDYPRYTYRGVMLDIARHYEPPAAVEQLIAQAASYKFNVFHLHLSDDQGFRIAIKGFPRLTRIGGQGSVGTDGRTMDPGGFWTQAQYRQVVADAKAHFMTLIPEVDSPGHNNAIIMSEYNDLSNPLLNGPQDINCSANHPPVWNYTEAVGYSALCPDSQNTWTIMTAIIDQLSAMTSGPYYDMGGDEVPSTILSQSQYADFLNKEAPIVRAAGKTVMGWADIAGAGTSLGTPTIAEYWNPASGSQSGTETGTEAVAKGMQIVMAPANHTYLDQKYLAGSAGNVPSTLGLSWACNTGCDVDQFYNWDPGSYVNGVSDSSVIGVEGAMWGETVPTISDAEYMVFPRLLALSEIGWSPAAQRTSEQSPAYQDFIGRLAEQGARLQTAGVNFYPTPEVPWGLDLSVAQPTLGPGLTIGGTLATLSAPGRATSAVNATIQWGDGTSSTGTVTGAAATGTTVNGLYSIGGDHRYGQAGVYLATVTTTASGTAPASVSFFVRVG
ncbi:MAG TPA: beta-N-acetylhexosaminidase [Solirubrobacteraceae bacterium]